MKKHPEHKIDELLQRSLQNLQGETSAQDWAEIQRRLQPERKRPLFGWRLISSLFLLLISASAGLFFWFQQANSYQTANLQTETSNSHISKPEKMLSNTENFPGNAIAKPGNKQDKNANTTTDNNSLNSKALHSNQRKNHSSSNYATNGLIHKTFSESNKKSIAEQEIKTGKTASGDIFPVARNTIENAAKNNIENAIVGDSLLAAVETQSEEVAVTEKSDTNETIKKPSQKKIKFFEPNGERKFIVGFFIAPELTGSSGGSAGEKAKQVHKNYFTTAPGQVRPAGGYNAGIFLQYNIWKGLSLQSGLRYSRSFENVNYNYYNNEIPVIDSATRNILGYIEIEDTIGTQFTGRNEYSFASIPFLFGYEGKISKRLSLAFRAGGSAMILLNASGKDIRPDDLTLEDISTENLRKLNWTLNFSPAIYYNFNKSISVGLEPSWQFFQQPVQRKDALKNKTFSSVGLGFSLRFSPF